MGWLTGNPTIIVSHQGRSGNTPSQFFPRETRSTIDSDGLLDLEADLTSVAADVKSSLNTHSLLLKLHRRLSDGGKDVSLRRHWLLFATHFHPGSGVMKVMINTGKPNQKKTRPLQPSNKRSWYRPKLPILSNTWSTVRAISVRNNQKTLLVTQKSSWY